MKESDNFILIDYFIKKKELLLRMSYSSQPVSLFRDSLSTGASMLLKKTI